MRAAVAVLAVGVCIACPGHAGQAAQAAKTTADTVCGPVVDGSGATVVGQGTRDSVKSTSSRKCPGVAKRQAATPRPRTTQTPKRLAQTVAEPSQRPAPDFTAGPAQASATGTRDRAEEGRAVLDTTASRVSAAVLTGGAVIWLLQSTLWTSLLILGLPLWRHVDLLPIVDRAADDAAATPAPKRDASEEQAVASVLDAQRPHRAGGATPP